MQNYNFACCFVWVRNLVSHMQRGTWWGSPCGGVVSGTTLQAGRSRFDFRWCHWNFSLIQSFQLYYDPGVDSASKRNEYQGYFLGGKGSRCMRLITLPPSCADFLEICGPQTHGALGAYAEIALPFYVGWGCFKIGCWERYLGIRRTR
jgi:hypothetical protein